MIQNELTVGALDRHLVQRPVTPLSGVIPQGFHAGHEKRSAPVENRVRTSSNVSCFHLEPLILWTKVACAGGREEAASAKKNVNSWEGNDAEF
ncbi:hypothetical protein [Rhizobium leguminosarum]|uniref:hypothetical protein n=1 Tax=Rhizobium leguminosarum TaxID=384 RepID=UPI00124A22A8|nr:hypothetical protein [Rhizobium leguminosarum]